jgi:hypothetical protein
MRLYVETMDAVVVEGREDGSVRYDREGWATPSFQERRAIIHAAEQEIEALTELLEHLGESPDLGIRQR